MNKAGEACVIEHGPRQFSGLRLDSYNLTLRENGGFIGNWVRSKTFALILEGLREARVAEFFAEGGLTLEEAEHRVVATIAAAMILDAIPTAN